MSGKGCAFPPDSLEKLWRLCLASCSWFINPLNSFGVARLLSPMTRISFNTPCYYFTCVTHNRLSVFRTDTLKKVLCNALNDARRSSGMLFFAYVIMPDHIHMITDGRRSPSDSLRYINGVTARKVIDHLKENGHHLSLQKLRQATKSAGYKYSLWEHHSDKFLITSEAMFM